MLAAVKLYELGRLSSGRAAELAGMPRVESPLELGRFYAHERWRTIVNQVFPMIPASPKALWFLGGILFLLLGILVLLSSVAYSARTVQFELSSEGLRVRGGLYRRTIPTASLIVEGAQQMDLRERTAFKPKLRTNGVGLPGYAAGWFRLRNGEKALLYVTDPSLVVYVPTREGYSLLLSVSQPESFLRSLRDLSTGEG